MCGGEERVGCMSSRLREGQTDEGPYSETVSRAAKQVCDCHSPFPPRMPVVTLTHTSISMNVHQPSTRPAACPHAPHIPTPPTSPSRSCPSAQRPPAATQTWAAAQGCRTCGHGSSACPYKAEAAHYIKQGCMSCGNGSNKHALLNLNARGWLLPMAVSAQPAGLGTGWW